MKSFILRTDTFTLNFNFLFQVKECYVNKGKFLKRIEFKGRGRIGIRHKPYSHLTVVVEEVRYDEERTKDEEKRTP